MGCLRCCCVFCLITILLSTSFHVSPIAGESSPIASLLREHLSSPGSAARRQLFSPSGSSKKTSSSVKLYPSGASGTPTRPVPIAPKPTTVTSSSGGGVTVTLLRDFLQQQQSSINQQLVRVASPAKSSISGGSPGRFDPASPLKFVVSMASAGTQTSPCRPLLSSSISAAAAAAANVVSPARNISFNSIAQVCMCMYVCKDRHVM